MYLSRRDILKHAITSSALTIMPLSLMASHQTEQQNTSLLTENIILNVPLAVKEGELVPVHISSTYEDIQSISLFVDNNPTPLAAEFKIFDGLKADFKVPVKVESTSKVTAVVNTKVGFYTAQSRVKVIKKSDWSTGALV